MRALHVVVIVRRGHLISDSSYLIKGGSLVLELFQFLGKFNGVLKFLVLLTPDWVFLGLGWGIVGLFWRRRLVHTGYSIVRLDKGRFRFLLQNLLKFWCFTWRLLPRVRGTGFWNLFPKLSSLSSKSLFYPNAPLNPGPGVILSRIPWLLFVRDIPPVSDTNCVCSFLLEVMTETNLFFNGLPGLHERKWMTRRSGKNVRSQFLHGTSASVSHLLNAASLYCSAFLPVIGPPSSNCE